MFDSFFSIVSTNQSNCNEIACKGNSPFKEGCWDSVEGSYGEEGEEVEVSKQPPQERGRTRGKEEWFSSRKTVGTARTGRLLSEDMPAFGKDGAVGSNFLEHISASDESLLSDPCTKC